jgi:hypothetical protein
MITKDRFTVCILVLWFIILVMGMPLIERYTPTGVGTLVVFLLGVSHWMAFALGFAHGRATGEVEEHAHSNGEEQ